MTCGQHFLKYTSDFKRSLKEEKTLIPFVKSWSTHWPRTLHQLGARLGHVSLPQALAVSIGFHALLLTFQASIPALSARLLKHPPLEVIWVNAKTLETAPERVQAVAQTNLSGGGDLQDNTLAASPLAKSSKNHAGEDHWVSSAELERLKQKELQLLLHLKNEIEEDRSTSDQPLDKEQEKKREALLKWLAQIDARIAQENARPRRRYLSPSTQKVAYALYYEHVRSQIETTGTQYFPQVAGQRLYGNLTLEFTLNVKGELISQTLLKSSGNSALDARAMAILRKAQPFETFDKELKKEADELSIVSVFHFNKAGVSTTQE